LIAGLSHAPAGAWRGDLIMVGGTLCMALYNVWSRPFITRSSPITFLTAGMGSGAVCLVVVAWMTGGLSASASFDLPQWIAILYLGPIGAGVTFFLWVFALERTTPTRVSSTITINPITASLVAALLVREPIGGNVLIGVVGVGVGLWIASTRSRGIRQP
jgi:drug/metabolite transporter (DMT)-like permease